MAGFTSLVLRWYRYSLPMAVISRPLTSGSDVREPSKNTPRAIFIGIGIILFVYLTVNYACVEDDRLRAAENNRCPGSPYGRGIFGENGFKVTSILLFLSVLGYSNVNLISNPRMYYAMAEDGVLPSIFKRVNSKTQVREVALTAFTVMIVGLLYFLSNFDTDHPVRNAVRFH